MDYIIRGGQIIDGSGAKAFPADIGIAGDKIALLGSLDEVRAKRVIDAGNKYVMPGFIDMHSHVDCTILAYPKTNSAIMQGVTTIVGGQCGISPAPMGKAWFSTSWDAAALRPFQKDRFGFDDLIFESAQVVPAIEKYFGIKLDYKTFEEFYGKVASGGIVCNLVPVVGHGQIRLKVMGMDYKRQCNKNELSQIAREVEAAMEWGAYGVSVGLDYEPGVYSNYEELVFLAEIARRYRRIFFSHYRKTGLRIGTPKKQKAIDGIREALEVGLETGAQIQVSHLAPGFDIFPKMDEYMQEAAAKRTLQIFDEYLERGVNAWFDIMPSEKGGIMSFSNLIFFFDRWVQECSGPDKFAKKLATDSSFRKELLSFLEGGQLFYFSSQANPEWESTLLITDHSCEDYVGKCISDIAQEKGCSPFEALVELISVDWRCKVQILTGRNYKSKLAFLNHPRSSVGADTFYFGTEHPFISKPDDPGVDVSHGTYSTFIEYLQRFKVLGLERLVRKATGIPAEILGLSDRGILREGAKADILVIDFNKLATNQTPTRPNVYPSGLEYVFVNGHIAADGGFPTDNSGGRVLRRRGNE